MSTNESGTAQPDEPKTVTSGFALEMLNQSAEGQPRAVVEAFENLKLEIIKSLCTCGGRKTITDKQWFIDCIKWSGSREVLQALHCAFEETLRIDPEWLDLKDLIPTLRRELERGVCNGNMKRNIGTFIQLHTGGLVGESGPPQDYLAMWLPSVAA